MTILIQGYFYPKTWLFELQVKQPLNLGRFYSFVFLVYNSHQLCVVVWIVYSNGDESETNVDEEA